ncbi:hypothetical protein ACFLTJ_04155 [Chloroflexota bacterium]
MEKGKAITSMMAENRIFNPPGELSKQAYIGRPVGGYLSGTRAPLGIQASRIFVTKD